MYYISPILFFSWKENCPLGKNEFSGKNKVNLLFFCQVQQPLDADLRAKIITIITIDVHARDVIEKFIQTKITDPTAFQWQSQLRFYWQHKPAGGNLVSFTPEELKTCVIRICDWSTIYQYEYVGNCGRLVITPLTDRCYITLTQALNLIMGGAPAGPAGRFGTF